jgi:protein-tyrosine phosphatase
MGTRRDERHRRIHAVVAGRQPFADTVGVVSVVELNRVITLDAVHNFRDLGGYPTADGRTTRWRALFRADGLNRLTPADLEIVRELGIRTVIDLRTDAELEQRGRFPIDAHPVWFHHLPIIDVTWDPNEISDPNLPAAEFLLEKYLEMLDMGEVRIGQAFHHLAMPGALPAVFHCAAGKDRTGLLAALVLSALGVPDEVVVNDYALTAEAMVRMRAWFKTHHPDYFRRMEDETPSAFLQAEPAAMAGLLAKLRERYGTPRDYVMSLGVPSVVLGELERALLVDD